MKPHALTGMPLSTLYTLPAAFAALTIATVWMESLLPNPVPFP